MRTCCHIDQTRWYQRKQDTTISLHVSKQDTTISLHVSKKIPQYHYTYRRSTLFHGECAHAPHQVVLWKWKKVSACLTKASGQHSSNTRLLKLRLFDYWFIVTLHKYNQKWREAVTRARWAPENNIESIPHVALKTLLGAVHRAAVQIQKNVVFCVRFFVF